MADEIYLDHNATTPLLEEVRAAVEPWLGIPANPSSAHAAGQRARIAVEQAREQAQEQARAAAAREARLAEEAAAAVAREAAGMVLSASELLRGEKQLPPPKEPPALEVLVKKTLSNGKCLVLYKMPWKHK